jgi:PhnB protein
MAVKPIPAGFHSVTPYLVVHDAASAIEFYKRAFGAKEVMRMEGPHGKIGHAELKIGDSIVMLADEMPTMSTRSPRSLGGTTAGVMLYLENVDATFKQAVAAGATIEAPLDNMFWGDRYGKVTDPFGHSWSLATHKEDVAPEEMETRAKEAMAKMGGRTRTAT